MTVFPILISFDHDVAVSLWRYIEKQPMTTDDQDRVEEASAQLYGALTVQPEPMAKKIGRPRGSKNKQPEPLFPPGSTYSGGR